MKNTVSIMYIYTLKTARSSGYVLEAEDDNDELL